ncbi:PREDICTED: LOW QUALITY PROTEIN [Prunus dulcis]|uniref:PREDICTED: LOW QUALITY PROTEIN n=3 Tax=Prunus dulcis TaxID=3755 RepID=A0A5E4F1U1_PRUDU|nr:PREDICTED: LOW QUALITY PROTEIN [Prunus dulcis]
MATRREHIEEIRMTKFSIGGELNPLTEDLHQAVKNLSAELYAKDVHFLMELIQNAEDNEYSEGVDPSLEFVITSRDITGTGAPATLLVFNNEKGFSPKNIESICSIGRSTKKGNRKRGYIGEKGIGFKSVFLITAQPYIFSNGYQIRFSEEPCMHCNLGYIVPEWVEENPTLSDIRQIYGSGSALPTTTLILPLKPDKVKPVKQQLSRMHPEVLLFLAKVKRLSVREVNEDPRLNTVTAIAISSETDFETRKNIDADSYTLHLSAEENGNELETECSYYMWKQKFPVKQDCRDEKRMEVDEWVITLAFPYGERLNRGTSSPGIYAFLPTEMITNLPFIIQADFLLASSRENILLDKKWNQGILNCVPSAFINAFLSLVRTVEDAPVSSLPPFFRFLPVQSSHYHELNVVRESIKARLVEEDIVPCEPHKGQKFFHKPREVGRLLPAFWNILRKAREVGLSLPNLSSHGKYILCHSFDKKEYDHILSFLGVEPVDDEWYAKCIQSSNLVVGVPEDVYLELLLFIADNWGPKFHCTTIKYIPLIKFVDLYERASLCSLSSMRTGEKKVRLSRHFWEVSWLIDWNREFISVASLLFMPKRTQEAIQSCPNKDKLVKWLAEEMKVDTLNVHEYAVCLYNSLGNERKPAVAYAHFLYHSFHKGHISYPEVVDLCGKMPLVNNYGYVIRQKTGVIVPANESKWAGLTDSNLWTEEGYVELGEDYMNPGCFAGKVTEPKQLLEFLKVPTGASDVPYISAPNACIPTVSATLTKQNAFLLLEWIRHLRYQRVHIPEKFLKCIKEGGWLKVILNGFSASRPPSQSFVLTPSWGNILQNGSAFVDIPLVDQSYYGERIDGYKEELKTIGVMFEFGEACEFIGKHLMSLAASSTLTRGNVLSILQFIKLLRDKCLPPDDFIRSIRKGQWLKTKSHGYRSPVGSVLFDQEWRIASKISDIPFIDQELYGEEIFCFKIELELLGVVVSFKRNYHLIIDHLKSPARLTALTPEAVLLMLQIMVISNSSDKIVEALKGAKCLKTNNGYKSPRECLLFHPEWGCLLQVLSGLPLIDHNFYGSRIFNYRDELRKIGAVVDFEEAAKVFARHFRQASIITKENVSSFLSCYRKLKGTQFRFPADLKSCIREEKWLRTRPGVYRSPRQCILYSPNWDSISPMCPLLPFIDDSNNWYGKNIHEYKEELKSLGVVVEFKDGVKFVPSGLQLPKNLSRISRGNALALLECIRILLQEKDYSFPDAFMKEVSQAWLKTGAGYRLPTQCLLFDSKFGEYLKQTDGPFIDVEFYGCKIATYRQELSAIGVTVEAAEGCPLIASQLYLHDEFSTFVRVYNYLSEFKWEPDSEADRWIWIPKGDQNGDWVNADACVVYDKDDLFGSQLTVLKNYFEHNLLVFFSRAYRVKSRPSIDDYCELWKAWETSETGLSQDQCCKFWRYVSKNWNAKTEKALPEALVKVPVNSGSDEIVLLNKCDVFLPDDLQLKDLFEQSSPDPVFVWYPQPSLPDLPRTTLLEMYRKIGVRTISESVQKEELSLENSVDQQVIPTEKLIGKVLLRLILGFLACPPIEMEAGTRRKAVQGLLSLTVVETTEPITVNYNLPLSSGEILNVRASRKIRWDREMSKFFTQKIDRSGGHKSIVEFATYFSEVISDGVLWEYTDHIPALSELIKLAFVLEFNEEAVDFFMKSKNLQIFIEDEEFLNSAFPSST